MYHKNGNLEYEGNFEEGGPDGKDCCIYFENGKTKYRGSCVKGKFEGYGMLSDKNGKAEYKGWFLGGKAVEQQEFDGIVYGDVKDGIVYGSPLKRERTMSPQKKFESWINYRPTKNTDKLFDYEEPPKGATFYKQRMM